MVFLVRNTPEFDLNPQWYFTNPHISRYLAGAVKGWETVRVGFLIEAFATAGCDVLCESRALSGRTLLIVFSCSESTFTQGTCGLA